MELTSLNQARLAYSGMLAGLYVGLEPIARLDGYAAATPIDVALASGGFAGLFGVLFAAALFAIWFEDRFWDVLFQGVLGALPAGVALSLFERQVDIFLAQPLFYAVVGLLIGAFIGYWLNLLMCARCAAGHVGACGCADKTSATRAGGDPS